MSGVKSSMQYDEVLTQMLVNEKSILGFLSTIFNFLARRTDFYYVCHESHENMGFPPGVAEELVIKVLRACDPNNGSKKLEDVNNEIMCSTVAQEVEVVAEEDIDETLMYNQSINSDHSYSLNMPADDACEHSYSANMPANDASNISSPATEQINETVPKPGNSNHAMEGPPPIIPTQKNCETYNGAQRDKYSWAQTIMDLDVTVTLPPNIKSSRDLKVTINPGDICVECCNGDVLLKDKLAYKIKAIDSFWSISEGKLLIHLEKVQERWWTKLLLSEENIDLAKIDCSRQLDELPDDYVAKIREMQWNQEQKMKGLPTSDQIRNIEILKKAWNAEGSPFKGKEFDPNAFQLN